MTGFQLTASPLCSCVWQRRRRPTARLHACFGKGCAALRFCGDTWKLCRRCTAGLLPRSLTAGHDVARHAELVQVDAGPIVIVTRALLAGLCGGTGRAAVDGTCALSSSGTGQHLPGMTVLAAGGSSGGD
jgi:hypothetical protein